MKQYCNGVIGWLSLGVIVLLMFSIKLALAVIATLVVIYALANIDEDTKKKQEEYKGKC